MGFLLLESGGSLLDEARNALLDEAGGPDSLPPSSMTVFVASGVC